MWQEFEESLQKYLPKSDREVISVLRRKYQRTNTEFRHSKQCKSVLRQCLQRIAARPTRVYMILNDLKTTLKLQTTGISLNISKKLSKSPPNLPQSSGLNPTDLDASGNKLASPVVLQTVEEPLQTSVPTSLNDTKFVDHTEDDDVIILDEPPPAETAHKSHFPPIQSAVPSTSSHPDPPRQPCSQATLDTSRRSVVERLEHLLSRLSKAIRALEEEELDMDALDSNNSSYLKLDGLKRRYLQVWHRLCDARRMARISGRIVRRRFTYTGCKYPSVNSRIEYLVNDKKKFPDYTDIRRIVSSVNRDENLELTSSAVTELAREVFIDVGHLLKRRRQDDLRQDLGCHLTDDLQEEDDPTYYDSALRRQLAHNKTVGELRLNAVFDKYVQLQNATTPPLVNEDQGSVDGSDHKSSCKSTEGSRIFLTNDDHSDSDDSDVSRKVDEPPKSISYEVLSLSSESDTDCSQLTSVRPDQSSSGATTKQQQPTSPIINLTEDDNNTLSDHSEGMAIVPVVLSAPPTPDHNILPAQSNLHNHTRRTNFSMFNPSQQFFLPSVPIIHQTQHASQTVTMTRQFGCSGLGSMLSTTQLATTKMVCHQLLPTPRSQSFFPILTNNFSSRPSRGRLMPTTHPRNSSFSTFSTSSGDRADRNGPPSNPPVAPDTETIVLD
ncbi:Death domain-associated protein 6 [Clonorchis sinensis]|uniref:Death domain-associated protein 6 n=1 Tax=Clonorchis sinensis TaxID=79923 RepID=A0A8T1LZ36_CLOSI|nr:Death domain-associated protein 6 [Clonorchis sinensis]